MTKFYFPILMLASAFLAQSTQSPAPPSTCTVAAFNARDKVCELDFLRLKSKLDDAKLAMRAYQDALQSLSAEAEKTKVDNHWDPSVQFDMGNDRFIEPPEKKPETKK